MSRRPPRSTSSRSSPTNRPRHLRRHRLRRRPARWPRRVAADRRHRAPPRAGHDHARCRRWRRRRFGGPPDLADGGALWTHQQGALPPSAGAVRGIWASSGTDVYAVGTATAGANVFHSSDHGASWSPQLAGGTDRPERRRRHLVERRLSRRRQRHHPARQRDHLERATDQPGAAGTRLLAVWAVAPMDLYIAGGGNTDHALGGRRLGHADRRRHHRAARRLGRAPGTSGPSAPAGPSWRRPATAAGRPRPAARPTSCAPSSAPAPPMSGSSAMASCSTPTAAAPGPSPPTACPPTSTCSPSAGGPGGPVWAVGNAWTIVRRDVSRLGRRADRPRRRRPGGRRAAGDLRALDRRSLRRRRRPDDPAPPVTKPPLIAGSATRASATAASAPRSKRARCLQPGTVRVLPEHRGPARTAPLGEFRGTGKGTNRAQPPGGEDCLSRAGQCARGRTWRFGGPAAAGSRSRQPQPQPQPRRPRPLHHLQRNAAATAVSPAIQVARATAASRRCSGFGTPRAETVAKPRRRRRVMRTTVFLLHHARRRHRRHAARRLRHRRRCHRQRRHAAVAAVRHLGVARRRRRAAARRRALQQREDHRDRSKTTAPTRSSASTRRTRRSTTPARTRS